jgi:hypothetical protein
VLRGMLLTEREEQWRRRDATAEEDDAAATHAPWWPPTKLAGRLLGPYLLDRDTHAAEAAPRGGVPIELRLDRRAKELEQGTGLTARRPARKKSRQSDVGTLTRGSHPAQDGGGQSDRLGQKPKPHSR